MHRVLVFTENEVKIKYQLIFLNFCCTKRRSYLPQIRVHWNSR